MRYARADGDRGRQEPARGARRGRGGGRPASATTPRRWRTTTATTTRWTTSATRPSTPARSSGRTACSRSSARSTSRWPSRPARRRPRSWPATRSSSSPLARRRCRASSSWRPTATRASPTASSTSSWARATPSAPSCARTTGIDGIVFTGSYEVGMDLYRTFSKRFPKPTIVEMGGKNPAIVSRTADLEEAAEGIMRSAFGFGGQKCSANSRVYVEKPVHDELVRLLVEKTEAITIGDPLLRENWLGPIVDQKAVDRHQAAVADARRDGTRVRRRRAPDRSRDWTAASTSSRRSSATCRPTIASSATSCSRRSRRSTRSTRSTRRLRLANDSVYGLTAGVYSEDPGRGPAVPRHDRGRRHCT